MLLFGYDGVGWGWELRDWKMELPCRLPSFQLV